MPLKKSFLLVIFWLSGLVSIYAKLMHLEKLNNFVVPFFTLTLFTKYYLDKGKDSIFYLSFFFCLAGDLMVMSDDKYYFLSGLMAYWGASILFYFALSSEIEEPIGNVIKRPERGWPIVLYAIYFVLLMIFIKPSLGELFVPICIYGLTLSFSCALGIVTYLEVRTRATAYFCVALILLSFAATFIGLNRFYFDHLDYFALETLFYLPTLYLIFLYFESKISS